LSAVTEPTTNKENRHLVRETFTTSRLLDFFSKKELTAQIGHGPDDWPLVAVKELVDNAIDACEDARIPPKIHVEITEAGITVTDNGPGIPVDTITGVLDFTVRVSSREAYISPCRGAQGNALKTLIAMPFVLSNRQSGTVEIETGGILHRLITTVDRIAQKPVLKHHQEPRIVKNGTTVTIFSMLNDGDDEGRFLQLLQGFAFTNPHLHLTACIFGTDHAWPATAPDWQKWFPSDLAPAHWYGPEQFERLIAAYLAKHKDLTVREFLLLFRGLSSTAKQKKVLEETGMARQNLSALVSGNAFDRQRVTALVEAMKRHSKNVKPEALGFIGKNHLESRMTELNAEMKTFQYDRQKGETDDGIPWTIETAFAWAPSRKNEGRTIITGVNWSPGIVNPFRELGRIGHGLDATLQDLRVGIHEPVVIFAHMACARVQYTDRGKSAVLMTGSKIAPQNDDDTEEDFEKTEDF
jgi:DNA topoisomerase VI subunit B